MKEVTLDLTIDEANLILEALGDMPYRRVYGLVVNIQQQASSQLENTGFDGESPPDADATGAES